MEIDQEHAYAFNDNPLEVDPLELVGTTIKEEIKDEPDLISENFIQHEVQKEVTHGVQHEVHHEIKLEDVDESYNHTISNSNFPSAPDIGFAQLDQTTNSVVSSSIPRGVQDDYKDVENKYAHSLQALRKQSDVLAQTHVEMQLEIANLKAEKAQLWKDLASERSKEYSYVKQIGDIKTSCDKKLKMLRNKYERMLQNRNKQIEDKIWMTSSVLGRKIESLTSANKNCMATVEALKDKIKLQEQYKSAIEIKRVSLLQKMNFLSSNIIELQNKLIKERKIGEDYLMNYQKMHNEHKKALAEAAAYKSQIAEKDSVIIVLRDQMHSHKVHLESKRQAAKVQSAAFQKELDKISNLERNLRYKDTLLEQLRSQKHKIIRKNKALVSECISLTEKLQAATEKIEELKNDIQKEKDKTCEYCGL
ncbi:unnamed protein product [Callosobruchus maculatus]|uniref:Uncharacterized protein n=1 Tax=Callosobruchus maculatus TaxID=64391 RepID=A0A653DPV2_CALMS|nr:unnamed protein product [Callosobruchus maculatus]